MAKFIKPTGARRKRLLEATGAVVGRGQTIASGAPELPELKKWVGLEDASAKERDWAFETWSAGQAKAGAGESAAPKPPEPNPEKASKPSGAPAVHCSECDRAVDSVDQVLEHKVYVSCHGVRQGVPWDGKSGSLTAFGG